MGCKNSVPVETHETENQSSSKIANWDIGVLLQHVQQLSPEECKTLKECLHHNTSCSAEKATSTISPLKAKNNVKFLTEEVQTLPIPTTTTATQTDFEEATNNRLPTQVIQLLEHLQYIVKKQQDMLKKQQEMYKHKTTSGQQQGGSGKSSTVPSPSHNKDNSCCEQLALSVLLPEEELPTTTKLEEGSCDGNTAGGAAAAVAAGTTPLHIQQPARVEDFNTLQDLENQISQLAEVHQSLTDKHNLQLHQLPATSHKHHNQHQNTLNKEDVDWGAHLLNCLLTNCSNTTTPTTTTTTPPTATTTTTSPEEHHHSITTTPTNTTMAVHNTSFPQQQGPPPSTATIVHSSPPPPVNTFNNSINSISSTMSSAAAVVSPPLLPSPPPTTRKNPVKVSSNTKNSTNNPPGQDSDTTHTYQHPHHHHPQHHSQQQPHHTEIKYTPPNGPPPPHTLHTPQSTRQLVGASSWRSSSYPTTSNSMGPTTPPPTTGEGGGSATAALDHHHQLASLHPQLSVSPSLLPSPLASQLSLSSLPQNTRSSSLRRSPSLRSISESGHSTPCPSSVSAVSQFVHQKITSHSEILGLSTPVASCWHTSSSSSPSPSPLQSTLTPLRLQSSSPTTTVRGKRCDGSKHRCSSASPSPTLHAFLVLEDSLSACPTTTIQRNIHSAARTSSTHLTPDTDGRHFTEKTQKELELCPNSQQLHTESVATTSGRTTPSCVTEFEEVAPCVITTTVHPTTAKRDNSDDHNDDTKEDPSADESEGVDSMMETSSNVSETSSNSDTLVSADPSDDPVVPNSTVANVKKYMTLTQMHTTVDPPTRPDSITPSSQFSLMTHQASSPNNSVDSSKVSWDDERGDILYQLKGSSTSRGPLKEITHNQNTHLLSTAVGYSNTKKAVSTTQGMPNHEGEINASNQQLHHQQLQLLYQLSKQTEEKEVCEDPVSKALHFVDVDDDPADSIAQHKAADLDSSSEESTYQQEEDEDEDSANSGLQWQQEQFLWKISPGHLKTRQLYNTVPPLAATTTGTAESKSRVRINPNPVYHEIPDERSPLKTSACASAIALQKFILSAANTR